MPEQTISYTAPMGESSDTANRDSFLTFKQIVGMTPFRPNDRGLAGLIAVPGWRIEGAAPMTFFPGISKEDEDPDGSPSATPEDSAYYRKLVRRTIVHPELAGTVVVTVYSSDGSDTETGRFASVFQELWSGQIEAQAGDTSNDIGEPEPEPEDNGFALFTAYSQPNNILYGLAANTLEYTNLTDGEFYYPVGRDSGGTAWLYRFTNGGDDVTFSYLDEDGLVVDAGAWALPVGVRITFVANAFGDGVYAGDANEPWRTIKVTKTGGVDDRGAITGIDWSTKRGGGQLFWATGGYLAVSLAEIVGGTDYSEIVLFDPETNAAVGNSPIRLQNGGNDLLEVPFNPILGPNGWCYAFAGKDSALDFRLIRFQLPSMASTTEATVFEVSQYDYGFYTQFVGMLPSSGDYVYLAKFDPMTEVLSITVYSVQANAFVVLPEKAGIMYDNSTAGYSLPYIFLPEGGNGLCIGYTNAAGDTPTVQIRQVSGVLDWDVENYPATGADDPVFDRDLDSPGANCPDVWGYHNQFVVAPQG